MPWTSADGLRWNAGTKLDLSAWTADFKAYVAVPGTPATMRCGYPPTASLGPGRHGKDVRRGWCRHDLGRVERIHCPRIRSRQVAPGCLQMGKPGRRMPCQRTPSVSPTPSRTRATSSSRASIVGAVGITDPGRVPTPPTHHDLLVVCGTGDGFLGARYPSSASRAAADILDVTRSRGTWKRSAHVS